MPRGPNRWPVLPDTQSTARAPGCLLSVSPLPRIGVQDMAKKEAPAALTGGAGFNYEDYVAARFLIDLLAGTSSLGVAFGRLARVDWQARDAGWLIDDLAL